MNSVGFLQTTTTTEPPLLFDYRIEFFFLLIFFKRNSTPDLNFCVEASKIAFCA